MDPSDNRKSELARITRVLPRFVEFIEFFARAYAIVKVNVYCESTIKSSIFMKLNSPFLKLFLKESSSLIFQNPFSSLNTQKRIL